MTASIPTLDDYRRDHAFALVTEKHAGWGPIFDISTNTRAFQQAAENLEDTFSWVENDRVFIEFPPYTRTDNALLTLDGVLVKTDGREWDEHEELVKRAIEEGRTLPEEILADYPNLRG